MAKICAKMSEFFFIWALDWAPLIFLNMEMHKIELIHSSWKSMKHLIMEKYEALQISWKSMKRFTNHGKVWNVSQFMEKYETVHSSWKSMKTFCQIQTRGQALKLIMSLVVPKRLSYLQTFSCQLLLRMTSEKRDLNLPLIFPY